MVRSQLTGELEDIQNDGIGAQTKYYPGICMKILNKITENIGHDSQFPAKIRTEHFLNTIQESYSYPIHADITI
jgi:hypothetical protein